MGWSGPGSQRPSAARAWGTHAAAGHRCRGGLKARAPSFGRPGFATGPPGSAGGTIDAGGSGGRAADTRSHAAGHGDGTVRFRTRAALTIAKSIPIDQLNVAMTSIRFRTARQRPRGPVHACRARSVRQGNPDHGRQRVDLRYRMTLAEPYRLHVNATGDVVYQWERYSGRECANPSSGAGHELRRR